MPFSAFVPPNSPRRVIGFFPDQSGTVIVWNWMPVFFRNGKFWSSFDGEDVTENIKFWDDVSFPPTLPSFNGGINGKN